MTSIFSLQEQCKLRIHQALHKIQKDFENIYSFIGIVDEISSTILSSCFKMDELIEFGISNIEKLELSRKEFPNQHAIYFITSAQKSLELLLKDYNTSKFQYGLIHIVFVDTISSEKMKVLSSNAQLMSRIKSFIEININFCCPDKNIFTLDIPDSLEKLYSTNYSERPMLLNSIGQQLSTLIPCFQKYNEIEILFNYNANKISQNVAEILKQAVEQHFVTVREKNLDNESIDENSGKITFLLLDRTIDTVSPILHDFSYQSLIHDLLPIKNNVLEMKSVDSSNKSSVILNDNDDIYERYRYKHLAAALKEIPSEFTAFTQNNVAAKQALQRTDNMDLKQMTEIIKSMPQYSYLISKYSTHITISKKLYEIFNNKDLKELGEIEQKLSTGITESMENTDCKKVLQNIYSKLNSEKITSEEKLRIVLVTVLSMEIDKKTRDEFESVIDPSKKQVINNLINLGITPEKKKNFFSFSNQKIRVSKQIKKYAIEKQSTAEYQLSRHPPLIEYLVREVLAQFQKNMPNLLSTDFPNDVKLGCLNINKGQSIKSPKKTKFPFKNENKFQETEKLIIFVVGGLSYNEISAIKRIKDIDDKVIIIGSTHIMNPQAYVNSLVNINKI